MEQPHCDVPILWIPFAFGIPKVLATCQDYPYVMAYSLLNVLARGEHSRTLQVLEASSTEDEGHTRKHEMDIIEIEPAVCLDSNTQDRLIALKAVTNFGTPVEVFNSEKADVFKRNLTRPPNCSKSSRKPRMSF
ncbi:Bromodomain-containing protein 7 [Plecturocebus cupreus]